MKPTHQEVIEALFHAPDGPSLVKAVSQMQYILKCGNLLERHKFALELERRVVCLVEGAGVRCGLKVLTIAELARKLLDRCSQELSAAEYQAAQIMLILHNDLDLEQEDSLLVIDTKEGKLFTLDPDSVGTMSEEDLYIVYRILRNIAETATVTVFFRISAEVHKSILWEIYREAGFQLPAKILPMYDLTNAENKIKDRNICLSGRGQTLLKLHHFLTEISLCGEIIPWEEL